MKKGKEKNILKATLFAIYFASHILEITMHQLFPDKPPILTKARGQNLDFPALQS
jgi:hypothetical protein